jgi:hypothetical protein
MKKTPLIPHDNFMLQYKKLIMTSIGSNNYAIKPIDEMLIKPVALFLYCIHLADFMNNCLD